MLIPWMVIFEDLKTFSKKIGQTAELPCFWRKSCGICSQSLVHVAWTCFGREELNMYSKFYSTHTVLLNICLLRQALYLVKFKVVNIC